MRTGRALVILFAAVMLAAWSGPDDRQATDPKSVGSPSNPAAGPIPIDELFFTRNVSGPSWSPDGKEIVFTTNLTGRNNLWKVQAAGGWPIQLSQSDDRQGGAVWSPDGKWILYEQDRGGREYYDIFAVPSAGGEAVNLTNTDDISETGAHFSPDGATLAISYKPQTVVYPRHRPSRLANPQGAQRHPRAGQGPSNGALWLGATTDGAFTPTARMWETSTPTSTGWTWRVATVRT